jgi:WD40 repeat protein/DNA-binding SARP family transcriptional activator
VVDASTDVQPVRCRVGDVAPPGVPETKVQAYGPPMQFRVLGALEVLADGQPIPLGGPKQRTVLATLLLRPNKVVPADDLIDHVWGEDPPDTARKNLQGYVTHLRHALGPERLQWRAPGYVLRVRPPELDAARFEALVHEAKATHASPDRASTLYRRALEQWRGPAFADLSGNGTIAAEAHRLEELRLDAMEARIGADLDAGRHGEVVPELTTLTREHPLRERLWGQLMVALYRSGRQGDASSTYHRAREVLADELGIDPSEELRGLHERILRNDQTLQSPHERLRGYELVEKVGEGGFGVVYRAWQPQLAREVAIKAIRPALANDPEFIRRFEAEAQLVARLEHANIVPLYDYWREPGAAYLVLRWIRGGSLEEISQRAPFDLDTIARLEEQIASALSFAHRLGIVHSDLKPANVLLDEDGNAYLSDFGIAADLRGLRAEERDIRLSPAYLSPEQIRGEPATPSTDVYCLGLLLYQVLCGAYPFSGTAPVQLLQKQLHEPLPQVTSHRPELPGAIDDVIARATAKDPAGRFPDVAGFDLAFREALHQGRTETALGAEVEFTNPYKGLRPFGEADALDFFGREALVDRLVARLGETAEGHRFLAVVGPSGSGKSSAVRAGLVPALRAGAIPGSDTWFIVEMMPGAHPFEELEAALLRIATDPPALVDRLQGDRGLLDAIELVLPLDGSELVLVIDQLEELFTHVDDEETRTRFLAWLTTAATDPGSRVRVLVTLRADHFDRPLSYPGFGPLLGSRTETVTPLTPAELELAIAGPAERISVAVEPELLAEIVADSTGRLGTLPLLQYALTELFERRDDGALTLSAYREVGGVGGALAGRAEHLYEGSGSEEAREATRQLFLRLVNVDEGIEDLRRRVRCSELDSLEDDPEAMTEAIDAFTHHRLLTSDRDPVTREPTVEVAHEALLRAWPRLWAWIDSSRMDLRNHHRLATETAQWEDAGRDPSFLLRGSRLERFEAWAAGSGIALNSAEREYLEASLREREAERAAEEARRRRERFLERRSVRRLRALVAVLAAAALVAASLTVVARHQRNRAERESLIATARELAAGALANLDVDVERSLLLALEAVETTYRVDGTVLPEAEEVLHRAVQAHRLVYAVPGYRGDFSGDGSRLLVAGPRPGEADVYDAATGERISTATAEGTRSQIGSDDRPNLVFSPDGRLFAVWAGGTADLRLFETATGEEERRLSVPEGALYDPLFSPDGRFIAAGGPDANPEPGCCPQTWFFDLRTGQLISIGNAVGPIAFPPHGKRQLVGDSWGDGQGWVAGYVFDMRERGWNPGEPRPGVPTYHLPGQRAEVPIYEGSVGTRLTRQLELRGHEGDVKAAAWSPDGGRIVTVSPSQVIVWDASTPKDYELEDRLRYPQLTESPPSGLFTAVAFGPDSRIATGMSDGTTVVWELAAEGAEPVLTLGGHETAVETVDFSPDGTRLTTSGDDGDVKVWDITSTGGGHEWLTLPGEGGLAYSPDGERLAVGSEDGKIHVYDAGSGREKLALQAHEGRVNAIAFDPTGSTLATAGLVDGTARILDAASGDELATFDLALSGERESRPCPLYRTSLTQAFDVAFSPNGAMLATGGWEGPSSTIIWDPTRGDRPRVLPQAPEQDLWGRTVDFSADGRLVAGVAWDEVFVWSVEDDRIVGRLHEQQVTALAFSPDGRRLATGSIEGSLKVWDAHTGRLVDSLTGNLGQVLDLAFSPDGTSLATNSSDGTVRLWDVSTGRQQLTLAREVAGEVGAQTKFCFRTLRDAYLGVGGKLAFSPDGTRLAYTAADGTVRVLALDINDLIELARSRLTRSWTQDECETYLHRDTCPDA